jgi:hypothetical protein
VFIQANRDWPKPVTTDRQLHLGQLAACLERLHIFNLSARSPPATKTWKG